MPHQRILRVSLLFCLPERSVLMLSSKKNAVVMKIMSCRCRAYGAPGIHGSTATEEGEVI